MNNGQKFIHFVKIDQFSIHSKFSTIESIFFHIRMGPCLTRHSPSLHLIPSSSKTPTSMTDAVSNYKIFAYTTPPSPHPRSLQSYQQKEVNIGPEDCNSDKTS